MTSRPDTSISPHQERVNSVKAKLAETGGVIQPWMYNVLYPEELRQIWASGDWIRHVK